MSEIRSAVPQQIQWHVQAHLARLRAFNAEVMRLRVLEQRVGAPGRYEWEYRLTAELQAQQAAAWLDRFATLAQRNGVDPDAVFAALGGRPVLEPLAPAAQAWQPR